MVILEVEEQLIMQSCTVLLLIKSSQALATCTPVLISHYSLESSHISSKNCHKVSEGFKPINSWKNNNQLPDYFF